MCGKGKENVRFDSRADIIDLISSDSMGMMWVFRFLTHLLVFMVYTIFVTSFYLGVWLP